MDSSTITAEQRAIVEALAQFAVKPSFRSPILRTPMDYDVAYEDVFSPRQMVCPLMLGSSQPRIPIY